MKQRKKQYILIGTLIACAGILGAVTFSQKSPQEYASVPAENKTGQITATAAGNPVYVQPSDSVQQGKEATTKTAVIQYLSTNKEGIIGSYAGKQLDNPSDNIFTVSLDQAFSENDKVWLSYELEGVSDYTSVPKSINDRLATGGYLVKLSDKPALQREQLNPGWLKKGDNQIQFSLPENAQYGYKVKNLSIEVEKGANQSPLIVNATQTSYDNKAYVHGFIQDKNIAGSKIYVDGKQINASNGEFETVVPLNANRTVNVKAILANGKEVSKEISFTNGASADIEYAMNNNTKQTSKTFQKGIAEDLKLETALLNVDSKALLATKDISITTLRHIDLPALDMAMSNVTASHKGYRFLPHGEHFAEGAKVTIKYDRTKLPSGYTEDDIKTYYFDLDTKHWVALKRDTIDKKNQLIVSTTTHFTDMINGVIQTPESPETQGFAPTMMNDIKAADPTAKVQVIAPPAANNRGSAGLSYGFEMPPARNGMQPSLGIQYNSDGGAGWLGEGWDLSTPSISVDTRWGVPRYDDAKETETYSMGGSMLMTMDDAGESSVAHRGDKINRKADRQFYPRNEGSFSKIIRKGSTPADYTWEVTDKSGTKYTYGTVLKGSAKTLSGNKDVIVEWKLSRVEELHGDYIEYIYETVDETVKGSLTAKAIYLKEVRAGNKGNEPHTVVTLTSTTQKDKKTNSARYGFLTSSNKLLNKVDIAFEGQTLRSYTFAYKAGAFNTNILDKVTHLDAYGAEFASHTMEYYDDVDSKNGYKPFKSDAETWKLHDDGIDAGFINPVSNLGVPGFSDKASALGGSVTTATSASFYAGVGPFNGDLATKSMTVGGSYSYSSSTTKGLSTLVDIDGDGLPDKVYQKGSSVYYRPNVSQKTDSETKYGDEIKINGISKFAETKSSTNGGGAKVNPGYLKLTAVAGVDKSSTTSKTTVYLSDINNDGLVDLVLNGKVYFNHIEKDNNGKLIPTFTLSSGDTPSPMMAGGIIDDSDTQIDPQEQEELVQNSPMLDAVRVWEAPFNGTIKIEGNVQLQSPQAGYDEEEYEKADGVRVAIQVGSNERWYKSIAKGDFNSYQATVGSISVTKGQKVYFRLQSGADRMSNGAFDEVMWSPVITYIDRTNQINPNSQGTAVYKASEGYVYSEDNTLRLNSPVNVLVKGAFEKPVTSDNVTLRVLLSNDKILDDGSNNPSYTESVVYTKNFAWDETHTGELSFNINNAINGVNLKFEIASQTNVALENIKWNPVAEYNVAGNTIKSRATVSYQSYASHVMEGQPYNLAVNGNLKIEPKFSGLPAIADLSINGKLLMAVKNITGLVLKQEVTITNGIIAPSSIINSLAAQAGTIWVEYYVIDKQLLSKLGNPSAIITVNGSSSTIAINTFTTRDYDGFGITNRGWGQFVYNSNNGRYGNPIAENMLKLPESENDTMDPVSTAFLPMSINQNDTIQQKWSGQNQGAFIAGNIISSSRLGEQNVVLTNPLSTIGGGQSTGGSCIPGSGAFGVIQETKSSSIAGMVGVMGITTSTSSGESKTLTSFADMNGDGYPDIITSNQIQFTNAKGGFDGEVISGIGNHKSKSSSKSAGYGGNPVHASSNVTASAKYLSNPSEMKKYKDGLQQKKDARTANQSAEQAKLQVTPAGSIEVPWNEDEAVETFMDVNGDGLPDKILSNKQVQLNMGYGFSQAVDWDLNSINSGKSISINAGASLGFDFGGSSISAGFGLATTFNDTNYALMDVDSDGLADKVWKEGNSILVAFNTGNGFTGAIPWQGMGDISKSASTSESLNASFTTSFPIPIPFAPLKVSINPGLSVSKSMSRTQFDLRDVDGDGFPEIVSSDEDGKMTVYRSTIARTNKLKSVNNPLGGSFTV
ncbi:SpvB/TcaC N-terminal domain-containing protein, partial [Dysgonomonas sp. ZJ709]|uniref:SpvB/TcaC N-terminal domain-containing protein n=1 Tax=Dysgonomonas sp. ZJ709 TaxID=2709797 RepID=UPI00271517BE